MKVNAKNIIRQLISPSTRFWIRDEIARIREQLKRACVWKWKIIRFPLRDDSQFDILFVGRETRLEDAKLVLGVEDQLKASQSQDKSSRQTILVSEFPVPGALFVPVHLSFILPLGRPIEEILAGYHKNLRKIILKHRERYRLQRVLTNSEIERADRDMLRPYAEARHGSSTKHHAPDLIRKYALDIGQLDYIVVDEEILGCTLGFEYIRAGKRYWVSDRWGCTEAVFADPKRVSELNTICTYLEIERAINNGFDNFDIGASYARPNEGTIQWKKRRGGELDIRAFHKFFYVRLPRMGVAKFLWDAPLFAIERGKLTLHLGIPDEADDDEIEKHHSEMGFAGLYKVYLYCSRTVSDEILNKLRSLYSDQQNPPKVEVITPG
jgi:hypothetical protein